MRKWLLRKVETIMRSRPPDFEIGPPGDRYMLRWHVCPWSNYAKGSKPKNKWEAFKRTLPAIYLHEIKHDDEDRALHDHPFASVSILLRGGYSEVLFYPLNPLREAILRAANEPRPTYSIRRPEGSVVARRANTAHRLVLEKTAGELGRMDSVPTISLFLVGFRTREWGFHCPKRWVPWVEFVDARDRGAIGKGCGD